MVPWSSVVTLSDDSTVDDAALLLLNSHIGSILISKKGDQKQVIIKGIITKTDLIRIYSTNNAAGKEKIGKFPNKKLSTINQEEDRVNFSEFMIKNGCHHVVVLGDDNRIVGITSSLDVANEFVKDSHDTIRLILKSLK